jgi:hypothetical protein
MTRTNRWASGSLLVLRLLLIISLIVTANVYWVLAQEPAPSPPPTETPTVMPTPTETPEPTATPEAKVTICHVSGSEDTPNYVELEISLSGENGHFDSHGDPLPNHEQDIYGPCPTGKPTATASVTVSPTQTETPSPTSTETATPTEMPTETASPPPSDGFSDPH